MVDRVNHLSDGIEDFESLKFTRKEKRELEKEIEKRKTFLDEQKLNKELADLENVKDDLNKCYAVIKKMKKKKSSLFVNDNNGKLAGTDLAKAEIIQEHFRKMLAPENQIMKDYHPTKLHQPFTTEEIGQAARRMEAALDVMTSMVNTSNMHQQKSTNTSQIL